MLSASLCARSAYGSCGQEHSFDARGFGPRASNSNGPTFGPVQTSDPDGARTTVNQHIINFPVLEHFEHFVQGESLPDSAEVHRDASVGVFHASFSNAHQKPVTVHYESVHTDSVERMGGGFIFRSGRWNVVGLGVLHDRADSHVEGSQRIGPDLRGDRKALEN